MCSSGPEGLAVEGPYISGRNLPLFFCRVRKALFCTTWPMCARKQKNHPRDLPIPDCRPSKCMRTVRFQWKSAETPGKPQARVGWKGSSSRRFRWAHPTGSPAGQEDGARGDFRIGLRTCTRGEFHIQVSGGGTGRNANKKRKDAGGFLMSALSISTSFFCRLFKNYHISDKITPEPLDREHCLHWKMG